MQQHTLVSMQTQYLLGHGAQRFALENDIRLPGDGEDPKNDRRCIDDDANANVAKPVGLVPVGELVPTHAPKPTTYSLHLSSPGAQQDIVDVNILGLSALDNCFLDPCATDSWSTPSP